MMRRSSGAGRMSLGPLRAKDNHESATSSKSRHSAGNGRLSGGRSSFGSTGRSSLGGKSGLSGVRKSGVTKSSLGFGAGKRRSSGYGRKYGHDIIKDPRPVNNKAFKAESIRHLVEFLAMHKFPHAISFKELQSPKSKDFLRIFEFIFQFYDPNFKLDKKHEEEIPRLLKGMGYPFPISKSAMFAIGSPHMWPTLLAALTWLREQLQFSMEADVDKVLFPQQEDNFDSAPEGKMVFKYMEVIYRRFLDGADNFEEEEEELARNLRQNGAIGSLEELASFNRQYRAELESLQEQPEKLAIKREEFTTMKLNEGKFDGFLSELEAHSHKMQQKQQEMDLKLAECEAELGALLAENQRKQHIFETQEFTPLDVERINQGQQVLQRQIDSTEKEVEALDNQMWAEEMAIGKCRDIIEGKQMTYNKAGEMLKLIPATAENAQGFDFQIDSTLLTFGNDGTLETIKNSLQTVRTQRKEILEETNDKKLNELETLEQIQEMVSERQKSNCMLEAKHKRLEESLFRKKEMMGVQQERLQQEINTYQEEIDSILLCQSSSTHEIHRQLALDKQRYAEQRAMRRTEEMKYTQFVVQVVNLCVQHKSFIKNHLKTLKEETDQLLLDEEEKMEKEGLL